MRKHIQFLMLLLPLAITYSCKFREDVTQYAAVENFANDSLLKTIKEKRAMIVLAHDDDMCALAGTISLLNKNGWKIAVVSFRRNPERDAAHVKACKSILDTVMFVNLTKQQIRNDNEELRPSHIAIPIDSFDIVFNKEIIYKEYEKYINAFNPTVLFTLDNEMGGYGHPEHVLVSQMVIDLSRENRINSLYIYQSVYTNHMESRIMERHSKRMKNWGFAGDDWDNAKKIYGVDGMPEPTVQIVITSEAKPKMDYLRSYNKREREILNFFVPEFEKYSASEYFTIFDREFFRVIKL